MSNSQVSQGVVNTIQRYVSIYDQTIQQELKNARTETSIPYESYFLQMTRMVQAIIVHNFEWIDPEDKKHVLQQLTYRGSRFVYTPAGLEILLLLKSKDTEQLIDYIACLTFVQYHSTDHEVGEWLYEYARDRVRCSSEEIESIQKTAAPLHSIVLNNSPSIEDMDLAYIDSDLLRVALEDFTSFGRYLFPRVKNMVIRIGQYSPYVFDSAECEEEMIYSMNAKPFVRVMYQASIVDGIL